MNLGSGITVLLSEQEIAERVDALAQEISSVMEPDMVCVSLLRGSFVFTADLIRALSRCMVMPRVDFMMMSSYGEGVVSSGVVQVLHDLQEPVEGRNVLLIDDILESGRTLALAHELMLAKGALDVKAAVLLEKPGKLVEEYTPDFVGFSIPDHFVVGYGLDYAGKYRELPFIGVMEGF